jgi:hypothetical protein
MISYLIFQSVFNHDHYLNDPNFDRTYNGGIRERIVRLRNDAKYVQILLDTHPCDAPPTEAVSGSRQISVRPVTVLRTEAGEAFKQAVAPILEAVGPHPRAELSKKTRTKQGTRLLKLQCPTCPYTVRITRKWLDEVGAPACPTHGDDMRAA